MTKLVSGADVFIYDTDGFQDKTKKAVAGVLYRIVTTDGRKANIHPVDDRSSAPPLTVMNYRLKVAGGSTTPAPEPKVRYTQLSKPASSSAGYAGYGESFTIGSLVSVIIRHDIDPKFQSALTGVELEVLGRAIDGCIKLKHPGGTGGMNGAGLYVVHPSRLQLVAQVKEKPQVYNGMTIGQKIVIDDVELMPHYMRQYFTKGAVYTLEDIKTQWTHPPRPGTSPRTFFKVEGCPWWLAAVRFKPLPSAAMRGPVEVDEYAYNPIPTAYDGAMLEVLEYRFPAANQAGRAITHVVRVERGFWMYAASQPIYRTLRDEGGFADSNANRWVLMPHDNAWLKKQEWLKNGYGSYVPALEWPAMSLGLTDAFNHRINQEFQCN